MLCSLELLHPSNVFYSSVLQFFGVLQFYGALQLSVCRPQWNGCVNAGRKVAALQYCLAILIVFCKSFLADRIGTALCKLFFGVKGASVAEKSWLTRARDACGRPLCRRFLFVLRAQWN